MVAHALDLSDGVLAVVERARDAAGTLVVQQVNGAFCRAFGSDFDALEGMPLVALAASDQAAQLMALTAAAARGEAHRTELVCVRPNGSRLWLGLTLMPASRPAYPDNLFVMLARDITKPRQAAEQQNAVQKLLANVFSVAEAGLAIVGQDGRFLMTNAFHDRLLGYDPGSLAGRPTIDHVASDCRDVLRKASAQQLIDLRRYTLELTVLGSDGSHIPVTMVSALVSQNETDRFRVVTINPRGPAVRPAAPLHVHLAGKIRMISLDDVKAAMGDRWDGMVERVMESAERIVARQMVQGDTYFRTKDHGFVVCFASSSEEEATFRAAATAREIRHRLIGAGEDPETVEVSAVVAPLPAPAGTGSQRHAVIESRLAKLELEVCADVAPPAGADGFLLERVIGKEHGPVLGYFARAVWPPRDRGNGIAALGPDRFTADLAALHFAEKVALERLGGGNEALFLEIDFDCFFSRQKTQSVIDICHKYAPAARERIVLLLAGLTESVAQSRVLDSVQRLRPFCRAVGFVIDVPELPATETIATVGTFVLLNAHVWDRSKAVGQARITRLAAGLHARKSSLIVRGVVAAGARDVLRDCGVNLFAVGAGQI